MFGRLWIKREDGWWTNGFVYKEKDLEDSLKRLTNRIFGLPAPCFVEWLNSGELKYTNFTRKHSKFN